MCAVLSRLNICLLVELIANCTEGKYLTSSVFGDKSNFSRESCLRSSRLINQSRRSANKFSVCCYKDAFSIFHLELNWVPNIVFVSVTFPVLAKRSSRTDHGLKIKDIFLSPSDLISGLLIRGRSHSVWWKMSRMLCFSEMSRELNRMDSDYIW